MINLVHHLLFYMSIWLICLFIITNILLHIPDIGGPRLTQKVALGLCIVSMAGIYGLCIWLGIYLEP